MKQTAAVILATSDGKAIMQLRDEKPGIDYPGYLTLFGGICEKGESIKDCAIREIREELDLNMKRNQVILWKTINKPAEKHGSAAILSIFIYNAPVDPAILEVREGQGLRLIAPNDNLSNLKITNLAKAFLPEYFSSITIKL